MALAAALVERFLSESRFRIPLAVDFVVLAVFLYLTPSVSAFWFLFLFAVFALATRGKHARDAGAGGRGDRRNHFPGGAGGPFRWQSVWHWIAIGLGNAGFRPGHGISGRARTGALARQQFLEKITGLLQFDRGLTESIRQALGELAVTFECEQACLAIRDDELERLFVWKVRPGELASRAAGDSAAGRVPKPSCSIRSKFRWAGNSRMRQRRRLRLGPPTGQRVRDVPAPPESTREEFGARSLLAVTIESSGRPAGRVLLINPQPRAQAVLGGRSALARADRPAYRAAARERLPAAQPAGAGDRIRAQPHLARSARRNPADAAEPEDSARRAAAASFRRARTSRRGTGQPAEDVQQESEELRRMVTDLRPVRVESADMRELMPGLRNASAASTAWRSICSSKTAICAFRTAFAASYFQIYRESLHNVKKHAKASHVVVKLKQDEAKVFLVVDDNGQGFSFSGRYTARSWTGCVSGQFRSRNGREAWVER